MLISDNEFIPFPFFVIPFFLLIRLIIRLLRKYLNKCYVDKDVRNKVGRNENHHEYMKKQIKNMEMGLPCFSEESRKYQDNHFSFKYFTFLFLY